MYNIVFMGTPDFAVECLDRLYKSEHNVVLAVSQMDKPKGRDMKVVYTPVKEYCVNNGIDIIQPERIKGNVEFLEKIKGINPDIIVVVAYGKILPKEIISIPRLGSINVHGSLLPKYRGAAPIQWSIINGDKVTGITTMYMNEGMDKGDMLLKKEVKIEDDDTYGTLYEKLKIIGGDVLIETLNNIENIKPEKQGEQFSIAPMIDKSLGKIDWNKTAIEIHNLVRGLNPMPGCYFNIQDKIYKVWETEIVDDNSNKAVGTIIKSNSKEGLYIQTGEGILSIKIIQAPNSKKMNICDYLRGKNIEENIVLQ